MKTLEQVYRQMKLKEVSDLYYGSDKARDTYSKDTPGQTPGVEPNPVQHQHKPDLAMDGVPLPGGELKKPDFSKNIKDGGPVSKNNKLQEYGDIHHGEDPSDGDSKADLERERSARLKKMMKKKKPEHQSYAKGGKNDPKGMGAVLAMGEAKVKNCGCGEDPCKTYGSKEEQMKNMQEAGRWDQSSTGKAYRRLSPEEKKRMALKNALKVAAKRMKGDDDNYTNRRALGKQGIGKLKSTYRGTRESYIADLEMAYLGEMDAMDRKKAAQKIFQMNQDKKANAALAQKSSAAAKAARADSKGYKTSDDSHLDDKPKAPMKKRGRGERDLPHIVSQLRGVVDTKDGTPSPVKYKDGTSKNVKPKHAASWLKKHDAAKPQQKLDMYKSHDSHSSFKKYAKEAIIWDFENESTLVEGSKPNNPKLWAAKKAAAKSKFDVYPSAYANGWAAKAYKKAGGTWRSESVEHDINELSGKTLSNYIQKSANPAGKKSAINLASRGATALAKAPAHDYEAGEKDDMKAYNRGKGMQRAAIKLQRKMYAKKTNEAVDKEDTKGLKKLVKGLKGSSKAHLGQAKDLDKLISDEKMAGSEYRQQMAKVKSKNPAVKKAVTAVLDKKGKVAMKHPDVDAAKKYMGEISDTTKLSYIDKTNKKITDKEKLHLNIGAKVDKDKNLAKMRKGVAMAKSKLGEATADQVTQARYRDNNDNPHTQAYMGKQKDGPTKGMKTYKLIPGKDLDSKKGKMAAIKKQIKRRPAQYGVDGKHDPIYPANKSTVQKIGKRNKSKATAGQYTEQSFRSEANKIKDALAEISDTLKTRYIKKAGQDVSSLEKLKDRKDHVRKVSLDRDNRYGQKTVYKADADKEILKRRIGMKKAASKLGTSTK